MAYKPRAPERSTPKKEAMQIIDAAIQKKKYERGHSMTLEEAWGIPGLVHTGGIFSVASYNASTGTYTVRWDTLRNGGWDMEQPVEKPAEPARELDDVLADADTLLEQLEGYAVDSTGQEEDDAARP